MSMKRIETLAERIDTQYDMEGTLLGQRIFL
jgi:hypothetical protein